MKHLIDILNFIDQGGIISWILAILYFIVMAITLERVLYFIRTKSNFSKIKDTLQKAIYNKNLFIFKHDKTMSKYKNAQSVHIINYYIDNRELDEKAFDESIEREAFILIGDMDKHIWMLSQIGHIAPLLGLLGTVIGLIESFQIMATLGADANVASFASGIWVAMITTANGLIVAIPSFFIFRVFERIIEKRSNDMTLAVSILNQLCTSESCHSTHIVNTSSYNKGSSKEEDIHESF